MAKALLLLSDDPDGVTVFTEFSFDLNKVSSFYLMTSRDEDLMIIYVDGLEFTLRFDQGIYESLSAVLGYD